LKATNLGRRKGGGRAGFHLYPQGFCCDWRALKKNNTWGKGLKRLTGGRAPLKCSAGKRQKTALKTNTPDGKRKKNNTKKDTRAPQKQVSKGAGRVKGQRGGRQHPQKSRPKRGGWSGSQGGSDKPGNKGRDLFKPRRKVSLERPAAIQYIVDEDRPPQVRPLGKKNIKRGQGRRRAQAGRVSKKRTEKEEHKRRGSNPALSYTQRANERQRPGREKKEKLESV